LRKQTTVLPNPGNNLCPIHRGLIAMSGFTTKFRAYLYHGCVKIAAILALLSVAQNHAPPAAPQSPEAFVRALYDRERHPTRADIQAFSGHRGAESIYSPSLLALIRRDIRMTPKGDVGKLDFDPICGCQDSDGLAVAKLQVYTSSEGRSDVVVLLHFAGTDTQRITLRLLQANAGWRVDDIGTKDLPSLRKYLQ